MTNERIISFAGLFSITFLFAACNKKETPAPLPPPVADTTIAPQVDPALAPTIGFFIDDWAPENFTIPSTFTSASLATGVTSTVTVDRSNVITKIPKSIAGNNANIWMTQMVTETSLIDHLTTLHPHIIRFPGGSISDIFFWNAPVNTPPADAPANQPGLSTQEPSALCGLPYSD